MNLTIVTDTYPPDINGAALTLGRFTRSLREIGHTVNIIHTGIPTDTYETQLSGFRFPFYKDVVVGYPRLFKLRRIWKKQRPDIIYVAMESLLGASAILAARTLDIPVVAGFHTNFQQYLKRYFFPQIERPAISVLRAFHNYCDATIVPSMHTYDFLQSERFENLSVVGRGVNTARFNPAKRSNTLRTSWGATDDDCVIIIVGRIAYEKNLALALETISDLKKRYSIKVVLVGEGPMKNSFQEDYGSADYHWAGLKQGEELAEHFASADLMLFASETETFGNVTTEALASGLITVAYDYAAARDHITDGVNGYTAPKGDHLQLKAKLTTAIEHKSNHAMKLQARQTAVKLTWNDIAQQLADVLENTIIACESSPDSNY